MQVTITDEELTIGLTDGRRVSVPYSTRINHLVIAVGVLPSTPKT